MTVITESELRELWKNGSGELPFFPEDTRFSAAANDFIKSQQIIIKYTQDQGSNRLLVTVSEWNKPGTFPVNISGPMPACLECGQPLHSKPEHMTQLDSEHFAPKTNPRIIFRGRVDSLHAYLMLTASISRRFDLLDLGLQLDTLAAYCREIMSAEYNNRPASELSMMNLSAEALHEISHWPDQYLGIQHLAPGSKDHEIIHWLNVLRTQCREVEVVAFQTFPQEKTEYSAVGASIFRALNRLSSAVYVLELFFTSGKLSWKVVE
ncbi:MAG: hypothetical protein WCK35_25635 [Chloroflexota bacterium]